MSDSCKTMLKLVDEWRNDIRPSLFGCIRKQRRKNSASEGNTDHINKSCVCQNDKRDHSAWKRVWSRIT